MYKSGDTIRLSVLFYDLAGSAVDPTGVALKIYNESRTLLETYDTEDLTHGSTGSYSYDYVIPDGNVQYTYEFSGLVNSKPILDRKTFTAGWLA